MNTDIIDTLDLDEFNDSSLRYALSWWEKKRIWYNIIVGATGCFAIASYADTFNLYDLIGVLLYGFMLNLFYSCGFLLEAFNAHYFGQNIPLVKLRNLLFALGTLSSAAITYVLTVLSYQV